MDKDILKLLPQKAFKLLSIKDSLRIGGIVGKSLLDKKSYQSNFLELSSKWPWQDIKLSEKNPPKIKKSFTKDEGEKILKIYFTQFFSDSPIVHLDFRKAFFFEGNELTWKPSMLRYTFSEDFIKGIRLLYNGFYQDNDEHFEEGLSFLKIINSSMSDAQKSDVKSIFYKHFGEGKAGVVKFSLSGLQDSFNSIFSFFLKEDIPLNPEFAVLGINLVTLYLTLENIKLPLDVKGAFFHVSKERYDL